MVATGIFTAIGLGMLVILLRGIIFYAPARALPGALVVTLFVSLWTAGAWRMNRIGVYTSDAGVRIRTLLRTRTLPWKSVARIEDGPATSGMGGASARALQARAIWIVPMTGSPIQTPLVYRTTQSTDFLPEPGVIGRANRLAGGFLQSRPVLGLQRAAESSQLIASEQRCLGALTELRRALRRGVAD
jgi:hypothetical protein